MKNVIAQELAQAGFEITVTSTGVVVSLNRPMAKMEVEIALIQIFDEIQFTVERINNHSYLVN